MTTGDHSRIPAQVCVCDLCRREVPHLPASLTRAREDVARIRRVCDQAAREAGGTCPDGDTGREIRNTTRT